MRLQDTEEFLLKISCESGNTQLQQAVHKPSIPRNCIVEENSGINQKVHDCAPSVAQDHKASPYPRGYAA